MKVTNFSIEDLLGIRWYDGLLIRSDHFRHADGRMLSLLSALSGSLIDQPGILHIDAQSAISGRLVEIESIKRQKSPETLEIALNITRPFVALSSNANLICALPNKRTRPGVPATGIIGKIGSPQRDLINYLVCARQEERADLAVKRMSKADQSIELAYPGLGIVLATEHQFLGGAATEFANAVPIASIAVEGDKAEIDASYIPPVITLEQVAFFDTGLVDAVSKLFEHLIDASSRYLAAGGSVMSREGVGAELRTRSNFYHVLNTMLMGKAGLLKSLPSMSPRRFYSEVMYPLTRWFDQYYESLGEQQSMNVHVAESSAKVRNISELDLCAGTSKLLALSREFIYQVNETIDEIA